MNKFVISLVVLLVVVGTSVSVVKYEVIFMKKQLSTLNKNIENCIDDIKINEAEWSSLNNPARLKKLCEKHLPEMKPMANKQILSYKEIIDMEYKDVYATKSLKDLLDEAMLDGETD